MTEEWEENQSCFGGVCSKEDLDTRFGNRDKKDLVSHGVDNLSGQRWKKQSYSGCQSSACRRMKQSIAKSLFPSPLTCWSHCLHPEEMGWTEQMHFLATKLTGISPAQGFTTGGRGSTMTFLPA